MSDVLNVVIQDEGDPHAPPSDPVLDVTLVGDTLHLAICEYQDSFEATTLKRIANVAVNLASFTHSLNALIASDIEFAERLELKLGHQTP